MLHPREQSLFIGNQTAESQLLQAATSGRLPHAWLIHGPKGVGKATLAYRFARFVLAGGAQAPEPDMFGGLMAPENRDLSMSPEAPTFRRVAAETHADLLVLEASGKRGEIAVEEARKVAHFLAHTPSESAWRVVIIDSADALNHAAANALLKAIEEPPAQALMLLVAHQLGRVLPTIRSRCRQLPLIPPDAADYQRILDSTGAPFGAEEAEDYRRLAENVPGQAIQLHHLAALGAQKTLLDAMGQGDERQRAHAHAAYAGSLATGDDGSKWSMFTLLFSRALQLLIQLAADDPMAQASLTDAEARILPSMATRKPLPAWLALWDEAQKLISDTERLNLDKKQTVMQLLGAV